MNIKSVVVHEIKKVEKTTGAEVTLTDKPLDHTDKKIIDIVTKLDESFGKKTLKRAKFNEDGFKKSIADFTAIELLKESKTLTSALKANIQNIPAAKGGYLLFCEYISTKNFLAVYLIRDIKSPLFQLKEDNTWDVVDSQHLDIDHFAMGAKINLDTLNSESEDRYVALIKGNTDVSGYFENWIGIDDSKQEAKDADALYNLSNSIDLPKGVASRDDLKKKIYDFVKSQPSNSLNLRDLSKHLYEDEDEIPKYCEKNGIDIDGEFKLNARQLNKFIKVVITAGDVELRAPRSSFSPKGIQVSEDGQSVVIHNKQFANAVIQRLKE